MAELGSTNVYGDLTVSGDIKGNLQPASTTSSGAMTATDKAKLNGIASGAQVNTVTSVAGKTGAVALTKSDVGLSNLDNVQQAPITRTITAGTGLNGGGNLTANRTLSVKYGTAAGTAAQGNDSRITGAAQKSANLSDLSSASTARQNLGLGTAATRNVGTGSGNLMEVGAKAADSDKLDGYHASTSSAAANTIPVRDVNGYLKLGWINTTSGNTTNASSDYYVNTNDGFIRKKTLANVRQEIMGVASGGSFLRSDAADTFTGKLSVGSTSARDAGIYGIYDSTKIGHIWSMGTGYSINPTGADFGNLYGMAYKHTNNPTGGNMAGGHQAVWCQGGAPYVALGNDIWARNSIHAGAGMTVGGKTVYHQGNNDMAGAVLPFAGSSTPAGWLRCNGAAVSRSAYSALFSRIGTTYGAGDGSTTFNLPDLRGEFIRGWDNGRGVDSGRGLGTFQADEFKNHQHSYQHYHDSGKTSDYGTGNGDDTGRMLNYTTGVTGGSETRPRNVALEFFIKY